MEQPREYEHLGDPPGQDSGGGVGGYASNWGFPELPKTNKFRPLFNTNKKLNATFTREGMADTKPITPPSSACHIYGKIPEKYFTSYFAKLLVAGNKKTKYFPKYERNLHGKRDMCIHHILGKCRNPNFSFYHVQAK